MAVNGTSGSDHNKQTQEHAPNMHQRFIHCKGSFISLLCEAAGTSQRIIVRLRALSTHHCQHCSLTACSWVALSVQQALRQGARPSSGTRLQLGAGGPASVAAEHWQVLARAARGARRAALTRR